LQEHAADAVDNTGQIIPVHAHDVMLLADGTLHGSKFAMLAVHAQSFPGIRMGSVSDLPCFAEFIRHIEPLQTQKHLADHLVGCWGSVAGARS